MSTKLQRTPNNPPSGRRQLKAGNAIPGSDPRSCRPIILPPMKTHWKTLGPGLCSEHGDTKWEVYKWQSVEPPLVLCGHGFHCSPTALDAMAYVAPAFVARVEVSGKELGDGDKSVHQRMRLVKVWEWTKKDSVSLAIFAAELVIGIYEKKYPGDTRPRDAIEAAKKWLAGPSEKNRAAASAAARAAERAACDAAWATARAANAIAWAACDAAWAAAWTAERDAAWGARASVAARAAVSVAASAEIKAKIESWIQDRLAAKKSTEAKT